jgi:hypothetical protein
MEANGEHCAATGQRCGRTELHQHEQLVHGVGFVGRQALEDAMSKFLRLSADNSVVKEPMRTQVAAIEAQGWQVGYARAVSGAGYDIVATKGDVSEWALGVPGLMAGLQKLAKKVGVAS